jgi:hypothetical protein
MNDMGLRLADGQGKDWHGPNGGGCQASSAVSGQAAAVRMGTRQGGECF